jgi:hypothetical protein
MTVAKLHLHCALYGLVLGALNWTYQKTEVLELSRASSSVDAVVFALLISVTVAGSLAWRCLKLARARLERGEKVPLGKWIQSWAVLLYLAPLLFHFGESRSSLSVEGVKATVAHSYGHTLSTTVLVLGVVGILLYQILARLQGGRRDNQSWFGQSNSTETIPA